MWMCALYILVTSVYIYKKEEKEVDAVEGGSGLVSNIKTWYNQRVEGKLDERPRPGSFIFIETGRLYGNTY